MKEDWLRASNYVFASATQVMLWNECAADLAARHTTNPPI